MSVFVRGTREGKFTIVVLHVDDLNVLSNSEELLRDFKAALQAKPPLKEAVYMTIPEGVSFAGRKRGNCVNLEKALYGLKQAS